MPGVRGFCCGLSAAPWGAGEAHRLAGGARSCGGGSPGNLGAWSLKGASTGNGGAWSLGGAPPGNGGAQSLEWASPGNKGARSLRGGSQVTGVHRASEGVHQVTGGIWSLVGVSPGVHGALLQFLIPQALGFRGAPRRELGCPMASPRCGELPPDTCTIFCTPARPGQGGCGERGEPRPCGTARVPGGSQPRPCCVSATARVEPLPHF